eukprot:COSAG01_NODE_725_length_14049_cov_7.712760_5_plen_173_part_00
MNEAIAATSKAEFERDAAVETCVYLERQLRLWQGNVTLPTLEDCWRVFRTQLDFEVFSCKWHGFPYMDIIGKDVALRFVGTVDSYSANSVRNDEIETTIITNGAPFYVFEAPWVYPPGNRYGDVGPTLVHLRTHELHYLKEDHDRTVVHVDGATDTLDGRKWVFVYDDSDDY